jgi:hypothetical protein
MRVEANSEKGPLAYSCECGNRPLDSIKAGIVLELLFLRGLCSMGLFRFGREDLALVVVKQYKQNICAS